METSFEALWRQTEEFEFSDTDPELCVFARKFSEWTRELCGRSTQSASLITINQSKVLLIDKYFEWRSVVPKSHRNRIGVNGHVCIFTIFEQAYVMLRAVELALTPPMLFIPSPPLPPPPSAPPPEIAGIFVGELDKG